ncbi:MAG: ATP-binding protein, partial [Candidatus Methanomethylicaceae archaeon]
MVLLDELKLGNRVLLVGPPGCGKTARVRQLAGQLGMEFIITPTHLMERVDFGGAIVPDIKNGVAKLLPLDLLARLRSSEKPTLWFLDDLGKAPVEVQGAIKSLITREGVGANLPPNVVVWGATNRPQDAAGVRGLDESLRSEFDACYCIPVPKWEQGQDQPELINQAVTNSEVYVGTWSEELDQWIEWATTVEGLDANWVAKIATFHKTTQGVWLYRWQRATSISSRFPDYRSWESVLRLPENMRTYAALASRIGVQAATFFRGHEALTSDCPSLEDIMHHPKQAGVPSSENPAALYYVSFLVV